MRTLMKNWKSILGVIVVFVLGAAAGSLATVRYARNQLRENPAPFMHEMIFLRMSRDLGLDDTQRQQLRQIMIETQTELRQVRRQVDPQMREILDRMDVKIRSILLDSQRRQYDKLVRDRARLWEKIDRGPYQYRPHRSPPRPDDRGLTNQPPRFQRPYQRPFPRPPSDQPPPPPPDNPLEP